MSQLALKMEASMFNRDDECGVLSWMSVLFWILLFPMLGLLVGGETSFTTSNTGGASTYLQARDTANVFGHALVIGIWCVLLLMMRSRFMRLFQYAAEMKALTALALLTMVSAFWSQQPLTTLQKSPFIVLALLFAYWIIDCFTALEFMRLLLLVGSVAILLSIVIAVLAPQYGIDSAGAWQGLFFQKNRLARGMLLLLPPALLCKPRGVFRILRAIYVIASLFLIIMSQSRTVWVVTICMLLFIRLLKVVSKLKGSDFVAVALLSLLFVGTIALLVLGNFSEITRALGKDPTLTGRTINWLAMIHSIMKRPILGYGYGAFWLGSTGESLRIYLETGNPLYQAHNAYLDICLELGFLGLTMFLITAVSACKNGIRCMTPDRPAGVDLYATWIFIMLSLGITEGQLLFHNDLILILYFVSCAGLYQCRRAMRQAQDSDISRNE